MAGAPQGNSLSQVYHRVRNHPIFADRMFFSLSATNITLMVLLVMFVLFRVRPDEFVVVVRFSSVEGFIQGNWLTNYNALFYALLLGMGNTALATHAFRKHRLVSFMLLTGAIFGQTLGLIVMYLIVSGNTL